MRKLPRAILFALLLQPSLSVPAQNLTTFNSSTSQEHKLSGILPQRLSESKERLLTGASKAGIESPTKRMISKDTADIPPNKELSKPILLIRKLPAIAKRPAQDTTGFVNPKVQPGLVTWHYSFDQACLASKQSHKPVLLFQMMGKLDDRFC